MIELIRGKKHRVIFQKNTSSKNIIEGFLSAVSKFKNHVDREKLLEEMVRRDLYNGRSEAGSTNTMGVRRSEISFYMLGYTLPSSRRKNIYFLSPLATELMKDESDEKNAAIALVCLFSMQFPHPFSKTPNDFKINYGRFIIKLLTDERIDRKIYIDEFVYFLTFVTEINSDSYEELVDSILEFRSMTFDQKRTLYKKEENYNDLFSNVLHESKYYFINIFKKLGCLSVVKDPYHNDGKLNCFVQGKGTKRYDSYDSRADCSGYIELNYRLLDIAQSLLNVFSPFEKPLTMSDDNSLTKDDFILELYENRPLKYLTYVGPDYDKNNKFLDIISNMVHMSRYGSRDGKQFEESLKPVFELFKQIDNVEIISGSGDTDLLCVVRNEDDTFYKINIDAKTSHAATSAVYGNRLNNHLKVHGSKYCILVSPRFATGVSDDINNYNIVAINADTLAKYCYNEFNLSYDGFLNFAPLDLIIKQNLGKNITSIVDRYLEDQFTM